MRLRDFLDELKRRRVVRAAVAYAAALFVVLQVADIVLPAVGLPETVMTGLVVVGALGFPIAMALAWALDLTPRGLERTTDAPADATRAPRGRGSTLATVGILAGALALVGASAWWALGRDGPADGRHAAHIRSLAVLPLGNLMGDDDQRHFVDGMHDILIGELSRIDGLSVISQRSVLRYRDSEASVDEIAAQLDVDALIEGTVFRQGDSVRITARLVRARPESDVWNSQYEGRLAEALALQSRVARAVADEIEIALSRTTADHLDREVVVDPEAMETYLLARDIWRARDIPRMPRAVELFEEAVAIDSTFALGWAGVADGYTVALGYRALELPSDSAIVRARAAIDRALALDPGLLEAHAARGGLLLYALQDFRGAERELSRVVELAPSHAQAHNWLADALGAMGRLDDALASYERAIELDPLSALMWRDYARGLAQVGRCEESIEAAERSLTLDPQHFFAADQKARCLFQLGRDEEAYRTVISYVEEVGTPEDLEALRTAWGRGGRDAFLREDARQMAGLVHVVAAFRYAEAGAVDEAFAELDRAFEDREALLISLRANPVFDVLHDDPRWDTALARLDSLGATAPGQDR